jgi:hypothetical protein
MIITVKLASLATKFVSPNLIVRSQSQTVAVVLTPGKPLSKTAIIFGSVKFC